MLQYLRVAGRDPWMVLGVPRGASPADIRAAWRSRARSCHPDRDPNGTEAFIELQTAYRLLTDPSFAEALLANPDGVLTAQLTLERRQAQKRRRRARVSRLYER